MASLLDQLESLESEVEAVDEQTERYLKRRRALDRSLIGWLIIGAFVASLALIFLLVMLNLGPAPGCTGAACDAQRWKEPAEFLLTIVSSVMLPVVTLVLGYYFGKDEQA